MSGLLLLVAVASGLLLYSARSGINGPDDDGADSAYKGVKLDVSAPAFRLKDQNGSTVSLSDFRGKVVVITRNSGSE